MLESRMISPVSRRIVRWSLLLCLLLLALWLVGEILERSGLTKALGPIVAIFVVGSILYRLGGTVLRAAKHKYLVSSGLLVLCPNCGAELRRIYKSVALPGGVDSSRYLQCTLCEYERYSPYWR